ncbi:MAG: hypothetical protein M1827_000300 [Pycnora praestabilis]|nr:MAG: hypothetical protein M1827_000300 [Pycnora praestabilis]
MEPPINQPDVPGDLLHENGLLSAPFRKQSHHFAHSSSAANTSSSEDQHWERSNLNDEVHLPEDRLHESEITSSPKRNRLRELTTRTKVKTKKLLRIDGIRDQSDGDGEDDHEDRHEPLDNITGNPAFEPKNLLRKKRVSVGGTADKALGTLQSVASLVAHPKTAVKSKASRTTAGKLSQAEHPYLSQKADLEFLKAHDDLHEAESSRGGTSDDERDPAAEERKKLEELEGHRESVRVAWTTSRHIHRARVVPKRHLNIPDSSFFEEKDAHGNFVRYRWGEWLGLMLIYYTQDFCTQYIDDFDELPFDVDSLGYCVERLVILSAPWQEWAMHVHQVYRWENPQKTTKWLIVYLVLWYTQHFGSFLWSYILYTVIRNYYFPTDIKAIRTSLERSLDGGGTAHKFGELIDKHGRDNWLGPMVDELGPYIQLQLGDIANILEVLANFYAWKAPRKTAHSLFFFFTCLLITLFTDMAFCIKIVTFVSGGAFFVCWPIASLYPKYRYLVSPIKWVLWDIPTHAEWSFQYLRREAQKSREQMIRRKVEEGYVNEVKNPVTETYTGNINVQKFVYTGPLERDDMISNSSDDDNAEDWHSVSSSASILHGSDVMSFRSYWDGAVGRLIVYSSGVRFVRSLKKKELWNRSYLQLAEMRKVNKSTVAKLASLEQLQFTFTDKETIRVDLVKDRDQAFNMIIGFSGLQWQALQLGPGESGKGSKSDKE